MGLIDDESPKGVIIPTSRLQNDVLGDTNREVTDESEANYDMVFLPTAVRTTPF